MLRWTSSVDAVDAVDTPSLLLCFPVETLQFGPTNVCEFHLFIFVSSLENRTNLLQDSALWGDCNSMSLTEVPELWVPVLGLVACQTLWAHTSHTSGHPFMWNQVGIAGKVPLASITSEFLMQHSIYLSGPQRPVNRRKLCSVCSWCNLKCLRWTHLRPSLARQPVSVAWLCADKKIAKQGWNKSILDQGFETTPGSDPWRSTLVYGIHWCIVMFLTIGWL